MSLPKRQLSQMLGGRTARLGAFRGEVKPRSDLHVEPTNDAVYKLGNAIQGLTAEGDALILSFAAGEAAPHVAYATGVFVPLAKRGANNALISLHRSASLKSGSVLVFDLDESNRSEYGLGDEAQGSVAVVAVDLGVEGSLSVAIFQNQADGRFSPRHMTSLQAVCQLARGFAASEDPVPPEKLESQVRIDALENEVREAKEFYDLLLHSVRQCYWMLDLDSRRILTVSENFEDVWGASRSILTEGGLTGFMETVLLEDRDHVLSHFHTKLGHSFDQEFRVVTADGESRWIWLRVSPVEGEMGDVARLVFIADDITDKKSEEERIRSKEAELISRAKAMAFVDLGDRVARQTRGEIAKSVSLGTIANELRDAVSGRFKAAGVTLEIAQPDSSLRAEMNETLVAQSILNLVSNAFDAVRNQEIKWVRVDFSQDEDSLYIAVTDSGPGIPIKIRSRIFDPFFTTKDPGQVTGLGLSLATSIAVHHNGSLRLDTLSQHTRFVFQIPIKTSK